jgi:uncharacterized protein (DUF2141 family)
MNRFPALLIALPLLTLGSAALAQNAPGSHFIENWDANGDGVVTAEEATEKRDVVFTMFDMDENDVLSPDEYKLFDETRQADMNQNPAAAGKSPMKRIEEGMTLSFNDANGDGTVSREEFASKVADWIVLADRNGDGKIDADDFGPGN